MTERLVKYNMIETQKANIFVIFFNEIDFFYHLSQYH